MVDELAAEALENLSLGRRKYMSRQSCLVATLGQNIYGSAGYHPYRSRGLSPPPFRLQVQLWAGFVCEPVWLQAYRLGGFECEIPADTGGHGRMEHTGRSAYQSHQTHPQMQMHIPFWSWGSGCYGSNSHASQASGLQKEETGFKKLRQLLRKVHCCLACRK